MAIFEKRPFWIFFQKKKKFFCFIPMKISPNFYGRMDGSFWCFPWFPENSLLCVILRYTVYMDNLYHQTKISIEVLKIIIIWLEINNCRKKMSWQILQFRVENKTTRHHLLARGLLTLLLSKFLLSLKNLTLSSVLFRTNSVL